jgi:hypothetical protein
MLKKCELMGVKCFLWKNATYYFISSNPGPKPAQTPGIGKFTIYTDNNLLAGEQKHLFLLCKGTWMGFEGLPGKGMLLTARVPT